MVTKEIIKRGQAAQAGGRLVEAADSFRQVLRIDPAHQSATRSLLTIAKQLRESAATPQAAVNSQIENERRKYEQVWKSDEYRQFSPGLRGAELVELVDFFRTHGVRSILDAGCGSGQLMRQLITEYGREFDVHGFDISANCLDPWFDDVRDEVLTVGCLWNLADYGRSYDGIICTDVMEHIPTDRVPETLDNLRRCTQNAGYFGIALFPDGYGQKLLGEPLHLTVKEPAWWISELQRARYTVLRALAENAPDGQPLWLHALVTVPA